MLNLRYLHQGLRKGVEFLTRLMNWLVLSMLVYLVLAVNATIVLRTGFGISLTWIMTSATLIMPLLALLAAAVAFAKDTHPRMEFILQKLPRKIERPIKVFIHGLTMVLMAVLCYYSWEYAQLGKAITITSIDFFTLYPFYLSMPFGFCCITIVCLERFLATLVQPPASEMGVEG